MGRPSPRHGAAVRGRTQNFFAGFMAKNFCGRYIFHWTAESGMWLLQPRKVHSGKQAAGGGGGRVDCAIRRSGLSTPSGVQGSAVSGATEGGATGTVAASLVFRHRTVAAARNRASGFGGDWRVRQQLPVGVGPDDRMPPGSREPKVSPASGNQNNRNDITEKMPHTMTGRKGSAAGRWPLLHFRQA